VQCKNAECGDGFVYAALEECDDGNGVDEDACKNDCALNTCQDGVLNPAAEECDDGNDIDTDDCRVDCTDAICGDGVVNANEEECDDNNVVNTDACKNDCTDAFCGDGVTQENVDECDDGNDSNTDACTNACTVATCGDGFMQGGEQCDDGNTDSYDGCSETCANEAFCYSLASGCPSGATQHCHQGAIACDSEAAALVACQVCMGEGNNCQAGVQVCNEAVAVIDSAACPNAFGFVYVTDLCSEGNIVDCIDGNEGSWCQQI
jgi:cysteine-rich repeat protein